ncbi:MAG: hypothetical protein HY403_08815 [Elusimicrobia bacterium]|nr:hypothetical protein [Elusimicrobiota bacterium]
MSSPDIVIRIDRRGLVLVAALVVVGATAGLLWSETLTLVTTYPSPSGIYNYLVTTGNSVAAPADTVLNRNAGNTILAPSATNAGGMVGIGATNPGQKLTIDGSAPIAEIRSGGYLMLRPTLNDWDMRLRAFGQRLEVLSGGDLTTPVALFRDNGTFKVASSVQTGDDSNCNPSKAGAIRWSGGAFSGCNGSAWLPLGGRPESYWAIYGSGKQCPGGVTKYIISCGNNAGMEWQYNMCNSKAHDDYYNQGPPVFDGSGYYLPASAANPAWYDYHVNLYCSEGPAY